MTETNRDGIGPVPLADEALASIASHVAVLDRDGVLLTVNEAWTRFGLAHGVRDAAKISPPVDYLDVCRRAAQAGSPLAAAACEGIDAVCKGLRDGFELEYRCDGPLDSEWYLMKVTPLRHDGGGAVVAHRNITAMKRREIELRERTLSMLVDALPVAVKILDADGKGRYFNTAWLRITGRELERELGAHWMEPIHPDDRARCEHAFDAAAAARRPMIVEYRVHRHDGTYRWLLDRTVPRWDLEGRFDGFICASLDITDRRMNEARLRDLTTRLVSAQEHERRRIARELHDDVNQRVALLAIEIEQMTLRLATDDPLRAELHQLWERTSEISTAVHNLSHELHSSTLDALGLPAAVRTLCAELSAKGLTVTFAGGERGCNDISPAAALGLFRIAQEALTNVMKHSGVREASLRLHCTARVVTLQVEDVGCGFDPLTHNEGLGLLSMQERVLPLGGELEVQSRPGRGTTIEVRVPREGATTIDGHPVAESA